MSTDTKTFEFDVTMDDLLEANGVEGLNDILDERMADQGIQHTATDISYRVVKHVPGGEYDPSGLIVIVATYVPDFEAFGGEEEDEGSFGEEEEEN